MWSVCVVRVLWRKRVSVGLGVSRSMGGTLYRGFITGGAVSPSCCGGFSIGQNLHGTSNANILTNVAGVYGMRNCIVGRNRGRGVRNGLCFHNCGITSLIGDIGSRSHFNCRRIICLLLVNGLPGVRRLGRFGGALTFGHRLPTNFFRSVVLGTPSGGVVGGVRHSVLTLCSCRSSPRSGTPSRRLTMTVSMVTGVPLVVASTCRIGEHTFCSRDVCLRRPHPRRAATRAVLSLLHCSERCSSRRTGLLSLVLVLRTRRNNNGGSAFTYEILASSNASPCSTCTTTMNTLGNRERNNTGVGIIRRLSCLGTGVHSCASRSRIGRVLVGVLGGRTSSQANLSAT